MAEPPDRFQCKRPYKTDPSYILSILLMLVIIRLVSPTLASPLHTPAPGTNERKAILDVERKYVEDAVAVKPVVFHDVSISVKNGWAFVISHPRDAAGRKLWVFAQFKDPKNDPVAMTLVRKRRTSWKLVNFSFVHTWRDYLQFRKENPAAPPEMFSSAVTAWRPPTRKADG